MHGRKQGVYRLFDTYVPCIVVSKQVHDRPWSPNTINTNGKAVNPLTSIERIYTSALHPSFPGRVDFPGRHCSRFAFLLKQPHEMSKRFDMMRRACACTFQRGLSDDSSSRGTCLLYSSRNLLVSWGCSLPLCCPRASCTYAEWKCARFIVCGQAIDFLRRACLGGGGSGRRHGRLFRHVGANMVGSALLEPSGSPLQSSSHQHH